MNHPDPPRPGSRSDDSAVARVSLGPSLDDLMGRIRLELTGSSEDSLRIGRISDKAAATSAEAAEVAAEVTSLDEVIDRIRRELKQRRDKASAPATPGPAENLVPRWQPVVGPLPIQPTYVLAEMLRPSDVEFVDNAFRVLLRRPARAEEKTHYLAELRGGIGKVEILGDIRFSDEGMQRSVHVDGLLIPYKLQKWRRIPVLGWFLAAGIAIFRLPRLYLHLQKLEATGAQESQQIGRVLNDLAQAMEARQAHLGDQLDTLAGLQRRVQARLSEQLSVLASTTDQLQLQLAAQASTSAQIESRLEELEQLEAAMMARLESTHESLSAHVVDRVGQLEAAMMARLESTRESLSAHIVDRVGQLETAMIARLESTRESVSAHVMDQIRQLDVTVATRIYAERTSLSTEIESRLEQFKQLGSAAIARIESTQAEQAGTQAQLESRLDTGLFAVAKMKADNADLRRTVRDIERRLMALFDRMAQRAIGWQAGKLPASGEDTGSGVLDAHYVSFEDTFRGDHDDIKARAEHYLTTLADAGIKAGDGLIVDLGCGRGEWLEVLAENGYAGRGVDSNGVMVGEALALGLDVAEQDAIAYLRGLDSDSLAAVTSMHLVEHLPYEVLIRLLDEALRVLRPGGLLILETPNPENLTVGSYWFYMDPTHRNPIPPALLKWVVEARGFESAAVDRLTQNRGVSDIQPVDEEVAGADQINKIVGLLTAAPDYAIVARKPRPEDVQGQEK